jgi:single-strand DNA-binding protein
MNLNVVHLVGRVGRDPEVKYLDSGKVVCKFSLAVSRMKRDDPPDWFDLELWDKTAEIAANYVKKGSQIGIKGSLKIDTWNDRNSGANRSNPKILVNQLDLLGSKKDSQQSQQRSEF